MNISFSPSLMNTPSFGKGIKQVRREVKAAERKQQVHSDRQKGKNEMREWAKNGGKPRDEDDA